jgi:hypothetical protein
MNPYGSQLTNDNLEAYQAWMLPELQTAMTAEPTLHKIRTFVARSLVRVGAWMLPDRSELVLDSVIVLPRRASRGSVQKAA